MIIEFQLKIMVKRQSQLQKINMNVGLIHPDSRF